MRMFRRYPPWLIRVAQVLILAALVILLLRSVDWREAWSLLSGAHIGLVLTAACLLTAQTLLSALRWRLTAGRLGIALPVGQAIREYYLSQVVNQSLPGGVLGDAGRAYRARQQAGLLASGKAVVFERLAGQFGLLAVLLVALAVNGMVSNGLIWPQSLAVAVWIGLGAMILCTLAILLLPNRTTNASTLARSVAAFHHAVLAPEVRLPQIGLSLGTALCNVAAFALCAAAVGVPLSPHVAGALIPMILFAMLLPLSISGWGLREGAAAALFPLASHSASAGLAASVAFGLVFLAITLPGLLMLWRTPNIAARTAAKAEP